MHILSWNKELETGIELLDEQHMRFFKMANRFVIKFLAEKKSEAAMEELEFLKDYLFYHFQTEETFQYDSSYPEYRDHQAEHKQLAFLVKTMAVGLESATEETMDQAAQEFADFVHEWVTQHILKSDLKFTRYYMEYKKKNETM